MSTDTGIDLVAYAPLSGKPFTIQVKTTLKPKLVGPRLTLDWWLRRDSPAQLVALVDLSTVHIWMFRHERFAQRAQQMSKTKYHLYMKLDPDHPPNANGKFSRMYEFERYLLPNCARRIFGV